MSSVPLVPSGSPRSIPEGFLRDIVENPDDDTPRLVCADWLEDNGDAVQGEYIRTQVALGDAPEHDPRRIRDRRSNRDRNAAPERRPPAPPLPHGLRWPPFCYRRGFPWMVEALDLAVLLREAPRLFEQAPIQALEIDARHRSDPGPLAASPWLSRIVRLEFKLGEFGESAIRTLLDSPHLDRLTELVFEFAGIRGDGLWTLLTSPLAGRLRVLGLKCNIFPEHGRSLEEVFAAARPMPVLETLDLSDNRVGPGAIRALVERGLTPALRELNLSGNPLPGETFEFLASESLQRLETLRLGKTEPGPSGAATIVSAPFARSLRWLDLSSNRIGPVAVRTIAAAPALSGLRLLNLPNAPVNDSGAAALAGSPHLAELVSLDLRRAGLTDRGARALLDAPSLSGLIHLDLHDNTFSPAVVAEIRGRFGEFSASTPGLHSNARKPPGKKKR